MVPTLGKLIVDGYAGELWILMTVSVPGRSGRVGSRCGTSNAWTAIRSRWPGWIVAPVGKTSTSTGATSPAASGFSAAWVNGWKGWISLPSR